MNKKLSMQNEIKKITEERNLFAKLLEESNLQFEGKVKELSLLKRIGDIISDSFNIKSFCQNLVHIIIEETDAENCSLLLKDRGSENLILKVAYGTRDKDIAFFEDLNQSKVIFSVGKGVAGKVALEGKAIMINDVNKDERFDRSKKSNLPIGSLLCCPLIAQNQILGVINLSSSLTHAFSNDDMRSITIFSAFATSILNNAISYNELRKSEDTLKKQTQDFTRANRNLVSTREQLNLETRERKKVEEEASETKDHLSNLIESSLDCIMVSDRTGYITRVNKYFLELLGYREEEVVGKHVMTFTPFEECGTFESSTGELVEINNEFLDISNTMISELIEEGKVTNWEAYYFRKDRKIVPIEQNIVYLQNKKGERTGAVAIIRDITERKKSENELRETKDFLENLFKTSVDGIFVTDSKGYLTMVNNAVEEMLGYSKDELIGKHSRELVPQGKEYEEEGIDFIKKLHEEGTVTGRERILLRKDGSLFYIEQSAAFLKDKKGNLTGSIASIRDITDRKRHQEELKKAYNELEVRVNERTAELKQAKETSEVASRTKSEFLANMSHELRTPLNHIIGFTELVVDKRFGDLNETQEEYLVDVLDSSKHLLLLINDILDLSKVEAGKLELEASGIDPRILIDNSLLMFKEKFFKHGIELSTDVDHIPETITADERKLKQILYNLLSNAVKFTSDGGKVCLSAKMVDCIVRPGLRSGDPESLQIIAGGNGMGEIKGKKHRKCVKFSVSDTGIGIKPEDQERIFSPFEQVEGSASRKYQGTGLGLSLTKKLVELHGGKIWVKSEGEGKGSTFSFSIPV
jgi:PAS domain S-box-containing protein